MTSKLSGKNALVNLVSLVIVFTAIIILINSKVINSYHQGILISICINVILAASLNLTTGFLGQITLGHAGFMSVGAYTAGLVAKATQALPDEFRFITAMLSGGIAAAIFGIIIGIPALRLKGDYLAIITLGFGEIIRVIIENLSFTGGAQGLSGIPRISAVSCFSVAFWVMALCLAVMFCFVWSRFGLAVTAIRDDDVASLATGINNTYYKVLSFATAAFFAGIAGGIYAQYLGIISAKSFGYLKSIDILVFVVLGGMGSLTGSAFAAAALTVLPEMLRSFSQYRMVVYSVALIVLMIFRPSGLFGHYEFSLTRLLEKIPFRRKA